MADVFPTTKVYPNYSPRMQLWGELPQGESAKEIGDRWFGENKGNNDIADLARKLRSLTSLQAWAVLLAIRWYWIHVGKRDIDKSSDWWKLRYRTRKYGTGEQSLLWFEGQGRS